MSDATDASLAAQYEAFPYPARDPRDEARRLIIGSPSHLREIDFWVFGARRPRAQPLHALVAGGGTGDGTIMLATHLARDGRPGSVTYLDRSSAALAVARARAEARGLTNIVWRQGSLLDLPAMGLGPFNYVDCCGVLHHLPDPPAGLAALDSVLAAGGGMGLMMYAPHGRTGVYMLQDALRLLAPADQAPAMRVDTARRVLRHLPTTAWLRANRSVTDHVDGGEAGLVDLLLNPRDRAFDVPALHAFLAAAGFSATCLLEPLRYDPAALLPDARLKALVAGLDLPARQALAEALAGNMATHVAYCVRTAERAAPADPFAADCVPVAREMPADEIARNIQADGTVAFVFDGLRVQLALPALAPAILRLINGTRSLGEIAELLAARGTSPKAFARGWRETWEKLSAANRILLAAP